MTGADIEARRERVARAIAQEATGSDPDLMVVARWPKLPMVKGGFMLAPRAEHVRPLWQEFLHAADAAIAAMEA